MADKSKYGSFVATTNVYDLEGIQKEKLSPEDIETVLIRLRQTLNELALSNNIKDSGYYVEEEFVNGQQWFKDPTLNSTTDKAPAPRQVYRKVINFGSLPNTATKSVAHNLDIQDSWSFTRIYGTASDPVAHTYIETGKAGIDIDVDGTNVNITTGSDLTAYTKCYVVLEFLKE